jgi:hypothetical protein
VSNARVGDDATALFCVERRIVAAPGRFSLIPEHEYYCFQLGDDPDHAFLYKLNTPPVLTPAGAYLVPKDPKRYGRLVARLAHPGTAPARSGSDAPIWITPHQH